jgi:hypothetical protein
MRLTRVKDLLARLDSRDEADGYTAEPCLTVPELAAWETANHILLPTAYRLFLLEIGNGGMMPGSYCDFKMWGLHSSRWRVDPRNVAGSLQELFPVSRDRFEQRMQQLQVEERESDSLFPELDIYWDEGAMPPGCLPLGHYPSYDMVFLIVSGDLRGMVWCDVDSGIPELDRQDKPFDFLGWFEDAMVEMCHLT